MFRENVIRGTEVCACAYTCACCRTWSNRYSLYPVTLNVTHEIWAVTKLVRAVPFGAKSSRSAEV